MKDTIMNDRLKHVMSLNQEFAEALARGDDWAIKHAECVKGIDGEANRRHPERALREDGRPRNWCGGCTHKEGCITCDLDEPDAATYRSLKPVIGKYTD
jgi:hypothetical protein